MTRYYVLDGRDVVPVGDVSKWGEMFEDMNARRVSEDMVGEARISTVFLGIDHSFGRGPPLLFETMIFGGEHDGFQERSSTYGQAEAMHARALAMVRG